VYTFAHKGIDNQCVYVQLHTGIKIKSKSKMKKIISKKYKSVQLHTIALIINGKVCKNVYKSVQLVCNF